MKMKNKGLGRIPRSLSWIDELDDKVTAENNVEPVSEVHRVEEAQPKEIVVEAAKKSPEQEACSSQVGLPNGWIRATFIVNKELSERIKALAYWDRLTVKEVVHEALSQYMHGKAVKPIPKKKTILL